ncbi:MAG: hypothetical protein WC879_03570 [Melioribacteraceae bacterium]
MSKLKIKYFNLFEAGDILKMNNGLEKLISFPAKSAALKYDLSIKLAKAAGKAIQDFDEMRVKLLNELSRKKMVLLNGAKEEIETKLKIIDAPKDAGEESLIKMIDGNEVKGKKVLENSYDLGDKMEEFQKQLNELLNMEIELECYPIKLSKLDAEDCTDLNFAALGSFIDDDRK